MATKKKTAKAEAVFDAVDAIGTVESEPQVAVSVGEVAELTVELDAPEAIEPVEHILLELHDRDDGWWGGRITFPDGRQFSMHAPGRRGVEGAAYRVINAQAPALPVVIKMV